MDESTYAEADGTDGVDDDHPIAWCKRYDGGRMWYTALGHTEATYTRGRLPQAPARRHGDRGRHVGRRRLRRRSRTTPAVTRAAQPVRRRRRRATRSPSRRPATDADGDPLTYAWDFGDGGTVDQQNPCTPTARPGTFTAKVTVTDGKGGTDSETFTIVVEPRKVTTDGTVGGDVPLVLGADDHRAGHDRGVHPGRRGGLHRLGLGAAVTSTAGDAALTVRDPTPPTPGKLVNGTYALAQPLQVRATNAANPNTAFAPVTGASAPLTLLASRADQLGRGHDRLQAVDRRRTRRCAPAATARR